MKNKLIKLICLVLTLALMLAFVGCKEAEENNSSTPTNSVVDTSINNQTDTQDEDEDEDEDWDEEEDLDEDEDDMDDDEPEIDLIEKGNYRTLTNDTVYDLINDVLYMQESLASNPERFLLELGMDDQIIFYDDTPAPQNKELFATLISYEPFKNKLLTYMTENYFESSIFNDTEYIAEVDGDLFTRPITEKSTYTYRQSVEKVIFKEEIDGKHKYIVWLTQCKDKGKVTIEETIKHFNVTIVKKNDIYVLDAMESIERKDALFKGYDKLNDETAFLIIDNYFGLKNALYGDVCIFVEDLVGETLKFDTKNKFETKAETLYKTNIKYKDFENAALEYMSKNRFKKDVMNDGLFAEKDGYLYTEAFGSSGTGNHVLKVEFEKEKNGKYIYRAKCADTFYDDTTTNFEIKATIIKQNGVYVLDSMEKVK